MSWPWPCDLVPTESVTPPLGSKRMSAVSAPGGAPARSIGLVMPRPRSLPRFSDSARLASYPSKSASRMASSMLRSNAPQS